jgi:glycosyltransferase involved in cell wall biosynthesis
LTLIEAMATGIPCVATDVGGIAEVVVDDETGLLAPAQDDARIAEHLARLATDQATRAAMGIAGRQRAVERFSDRQMHTAYHRLYCEITNLECSDLSELSVPQDSHQ